jgi:hypothetical protein
MSSIRNPSTHLFRSSKKQQEFFAISTGKKRFSYQWRNMWAIDWHGSPLHISSLQKNSLRIEQFYNLAVTAGEGSWILAADFCERGGRKNKIPRSREMYLLDR